MIAADYLPLEWARQIKQGSDEIAKVFDRGYILGFMNRDAADLVTYQYVCNVMYARERGVSA